jgi:hypothetical protein
LGDVLTNADLAASVIAAVHRASGEQENYGATAFANTMDDLADEITGIFAAAGFFPNKKSARAEALAPSPRQPVRA